MMDRRQDEDDLKLPPVGTSVAGVDVNDREEEEEEEEAGSDASLQQQHTKQRTTSKQQNKWARKIKKSPHAPKRFKSSYIFFSAEKHKEIRQQLASLGIQETTGNVAKMVSKAWRSLSPDEREVYEEMSRKDKARYEVEKTMYKGAWTVPIGYKRPKDATAPKRPMPAFFAFSNKRRAMVKAQIPDASNAQVSKALSQMWKEAPDVLREQYKHEEAELGRKYKVDIAEWRRNEDEAMKRRQESAMRIAESGGGDAAPPDDAAQRDVLEQHSNAVPGAFNLPAPALFQMQYLQQETLLMNHQQGNLSPQRLRHHPSPVASLAAAHHTSTSSTAPYYHYHQGAVDGDDATWNQQQPSLLANSSTSGANADTAAAGQQTRMMVAGGNQIDSTSTAGLVLGPYYAGGATSFRSNPPQPIQEEHQARLMELIAATRRGQNQHPRGHHQYDYHQQQQHHQTMRHHDTDPSFRVGGRALAGSMLPEDDHQYYRGHTVAGGQAAATSTVNPFSVPAAASSAARLEEGTLVDAYNYNTNQNVAVPPAQHQYTEAQLLAFLLQQQQQQQQQQGMFEQEQQQEEEQQQQGGDGGTSNSAIFLAPGGDDAHHGTAEGDSSLDPDAAAGEGAYKTSGDPVPGGGGVAARRTMNEDEGMHHRQSTTTINNDGFNSTDEQEMILRTTNTAADRQQGSSSSSPPSSADLLDRGERSSGSLRWGGGEGGHSSYVESTGSFLSSIDETDLPN